MKTIIAARKVALCVALILGVILGAPGCRQEAEQVAQSAPLELTLAMQNAPSSGLIAVADEKDYFKQAGVQVKMILYPSGLDSLKAMMRGEAQVATVADIAFASKMDEDPSLRVVASIGLTAGNRIVARKDRNIHKPSDLKGKKIGYSPGTSSDYFFHAFLLVNEIPRNEITAVAIPPAKQAEAVMAGEVDAVSAFDIYAFIASTGLGENAVSWDSQNNLDYQWLLAARESSTEFPEAIKRLLKALIKAEESILTNEDEAKSIIARKWDFSPEYIRHAWSQTRLFVSFNQSIITSLQNYAKWEIQRKGRTEAPPDVLPYLYTGALDQIDPSLISIFR